MKTFSTTALCVPDGHHMLPVLAMLLSSYLPNVYDGAAG